MAKTVSKKRTTKSSSISNRRTSKKPSYSKKTIPAKQSKSSRKKTSSLKPISRDRQIDILGIVLIVIGIVTLMNLMTADIGKISGWWISFLIRIFGWGVYLLPICLIFCGLRILLRKLNNFPQFSSERTIGFTFGYFNLLSWFHLIEVGRGGSIGLWIVNNLQNWLGKAGSYVALIAWLLTSLILLLDLSMADVSKWVENKIRKCNQGLNQIITKQKEKTRLAKAIKQSSKHEEFIKKVDNDNFDNQKIHADVEQETNNVELNLSENRNEGSQRNWVLPNPGKLLYPIPKAPISEEVDKHRARVIEETLKSFGAPAHVVEIRRGPAITMFGVKPDYIENRKGQTMVRVSNIVRLQDDIAMALQATQIRIQAPVPGKDYVGIELPNGDVDPVSLLEIITNPAFINNKGPLRFGLGKDVSGTPVAADLTNMPHLLIAGATNSGKSVCINAILTGYLLTLTPDQLRIIMVDPKRVELTGYNGIPHLLSPVIVDAERVVGALQWLLREMDLRYHKFSDAGARNIIEYNMKQKAQKKQILPYLLLVIDEMADLMMLAPDETERSITRLAQLARATGIHLILATQRPSVDILTGLIKANFPARIAFAVASGMDSRVILDQLGAERLLGRGDMLFQAPDAPAPVRLQGTYVSDQEINNLVNFWHQQAMQNNSPSQSDQPVVFTKQSTTPLKQQPLFEEFQEDPDEDPITKEAIAIIRKEGRASISLLQRKLRIGYTRSARLIENLEKKGIVGPPNPQTQVREVLDYGKSSPPVDQ